MKRLFLLFSLLSMMFLSVKAQGGEDIEQYLDDGGISTAKYFLKVAPLDFYQGDIGAYVERLFTRSFSLEAGAGILPCYYNDYLIPGFSGKVDFNKPNFGFSFALSPRLRSSLFGILDISLPVKVRIYPSQLLLYDFSLNIGKEWIWNSGFLLDVGIGFGVQNQNSFNGYYMFGDSSNSARVIFPINLKFGYRF